MPHGLLSTLHTRLAVHIWAYGCSVQCSGLNMCFPSPPLLLPGSDGASLCRVTLLFLQLSLCCLLPTLVAVWRLAPPVEDEDEGEGQREEEESGEEESEWEEVQRGMPPPPQHRPHSIEGQTIWAARAEAGGGGPRAVEPHCTGEGLEGQHQVLVGLVAACWAAAQWAGQQAP